MTLSISGYVDPGVYVGEVITPGAISLATVPDVVAVVAYGNRSKRSLNEAVMRGQVFGEAITLASVAPHTATLVNRGDRRVTNSTVRRTLAGTTITLPYNALTYVTASLTGSAITTVDMTAAKAIGFKMDGGQDVTISLIHNAAPSVVIAGSLITVKYTFAAPAAATRAEIAAAINGALSAASALGYGAAYAAVTTNTGTALAFTSPSAVSASDVQIVRPFVGSSAPVGYDATAALGFTIPGSGVLAAPTVLRVADLYYDATASYEADYVAINTLLDSLQYDATNMVRVGSFANVTSFFVNTDYVLNSGNIDWSADTGASFTGANTETFNVSTNNTIVLALDGKGAVTIKLDALASPPVGYANPAVNTAATAAELVNNINAVMAVASGYGPKYKAVGVNAAGKVQITSPNQGVASSVEISAPGALSAVQAIFGLITSQLPYTVLGTGNKPIPSTMYFATYEYIRPTEDYNLAKRFYSEVQMIQDLTPVAPANLLSIYGQIAFENNAPSIVCCQINDATTPGAPSVIETQVAIDGLKQSSITTDVIVADTRLSVQTYLMSHIEVQSSPTEKNYRTGWFGMPKGTAIGDSDTPNTFVYRAATTLQVSPDSPARGRYVLVAPSQADRTLLLEDGTQVTMTFDSTAIAVAIAATHTSFTSPAVSLASKTIIGFIPDTFPQYVRAERAQLASNGVMVVTYDGGVLRILDPVTTEAGGGKLPQFSYRECASQKDNVSRAVEKIIKNNLVGVVPDDLADFVFDIKINIASVLTSLIEVGAIGPFRDANGVSRDISLAKDVQAQQSTTDPTKFFFKYFFFLRYPALRFFGEFSVDNPFMNA